MTSGRALAIFSAAAMTAENSRSTISALASPWSSMKASARGVEAGVERVEHRAAHRDAVVALEHRRRIGEHGRDRVAARKSPLGERRGETARARVEVAIGPAQRSVDDREAIGEHRRRALEKRRAASAAGNWRGCDRDRDHKAKSACRPLSSSDGAHHSAPAARCEAPHVRHGALQTRKAKKRKPTKVTTIATPLPTATNSGRMAGVTATPTRGRGEDAGRIDGVVDREPRRRDQAIAQERADQRRVGVAEGDRPVEREIDDRRDDEARRAGELRRQAQMLGAEDR